MPVDINPNFKVTGVELILIKLHSGAKFSNNQYPFSCGQHGVNALSTKFEVCVNRGGSEHLVTFSGTGGTLAAIFQKIDGPDPRVEDRSRRSSSQALGERFCWARPI